MTGCPSTCTYRDRLPGLNLLPSRPAAAGTLIGCIPGALRSFRARPTPNQFHYNVSGSPQVETAYVAPFNRSGELNLAPEYRIMAREIPSLSLTTFPLETTDE